MSTSTAGSEDLPQHFTDRVEWGSGYTSGGYAPVHIGDTLDERYTVIHKLGHGGFATVWLARDDITQHYVALKIIKASESSEKAILEFLGERQSAHPGRQHIVLLLDVFNMTSPNGVHECLVFDLKGPCVRSFDRDNCFRRLRGNHARTFCRQLLLAIDYIHSHNIVHADITPGNIMLSLKDEVHRCSTQEILDLIGHPDKIAVESFSGAKVPASHPKYVVAPANLWGLASMMTAEICLSDFGQAFSTTTESVRHSLGGIPPGFKAPEVWFERTQGAAADLWAAGCCMFYLRIGYDLVDIMGGVTTAVTSIAHFLGNLPEKWASLYFDNLTNAKFRSEYEQNKAQRKLIGSGPRPDRPLEPQVLDVWPSGPSERSLTTTLQQSYESVQFVSQIPKLRLEKSDVEKAQDYLRVKFSEDEAICMADLLSRLLTWEPQNRASAHQLSNHKWFDNEKFADADILPVETCSLLQVDINYSDSHDAFPTSEDSGSSSLRDSPVPEILD